MRASNPEWLNHRSTAAVSLRVALDGQRIRSPGRTPSRPYRHRRSSCRHRQFLEQRENGVWNVNSAPAMPPPSPLKGPVTSVGDRHRSSTGVGGVADVAVDVLVEHRQRGERFLGGNTTRTRRPPGWRRNGSSAGLPPLPVKGCVSLYNVREARSSSSGGRAITRARPKRRILSSARLNVDVHARAALRRSRCRAIERLRARRR